VLITLLLPLCPSHVHICIHSMLRIKTEMTCTMHYAIRPCFSPNRRYLTARTTTMTRYPAGELIEKASKTLSVRYAPRDATFTITYKNKRAVLLASEYWGHRHLLEDVYVIGHILALIVIPQNGNKVWHWMMTIEPRQFVAAKRHTRCTGYQTWECCTA